METGPARGGGAERPRERDAVYRTSEGLLLAEVTTETKAAKVGEDATKLANMGKMRLAQHSDTPVRAYVVTSSDPTAHQRDAVRAVAQRELFPIEIISYEALKRRLFDARDYLALRKNHYFGSARDPITGSATHIGPYIPSQMANGSIVLDPKRLAESIEKQPRSRTVILGDYGVGKSVALMELFRAFANRYLKSDTGLVPLHLNLREHYGQTETDEALHRHAKRIGFAKPDQLVRAWRSGFVCIILDGFDEITGGRWAAVPRDIRAIRRASVSLVKAFVDESPETSPLVVAGRRFYFDTDIEMLLAFGADAKRTDIFVINEFSDSQVREYLRRRKIASHIPEWFPSRPLLLAELARLEAIEDLGDLKDLSPPSAWSTMLDRVCEREAHQAAFIDGATVRRVLERLATLGRRSSDGLAPISFQEVRAIFEDIAGIPADDASISILTRLPGLGTEPTVSEEGIRRFVDQDLADVLRAGDVSRYVASPYGKDAAQPFEDCQCTIGSLATGVVSAKLADQGANDRHILAAVQRQESVSLTYLALDMFAVCRERSIPIAAAVRLPIADAFVETSLDFSEVEGDYSSVAFLECWLHELVLPRERSDDKWLPSFEKCIFNRIVGRVGVSELPIDHFRSCDFRKTAFADAEAILTTAGLLTLDSFPPGQRVLLTILKKLYFQSGRARKESAFVRGLPLQDRGLVPPVLQLVRQYGLAEKGSGNAAGLWFSLRNARPRVRLIIESPGSSKERVWNDSAALTG